MSTSAFTATKASVHTTSSADSQPISRRTFARVAALGAAAALAGAGTLAASSAATGEDAGLLGGLLPRRAYAGSYDQVIQVREDNATRLMTSYYSVVVPDSLAPRGFSYGYNGTLGDYSGGTEGLLWGYDLSVDFPDGTGFFVRCHSLNWSGIQGTFVFRDIGVSSSDSSLMVTIASGSGTALGDFTQAGAVVGTFAPYVSTTVTSAPAGSGSYGGDWYGYLCNLYDRLGSYDAQVRDMATTFNNDFLNANLAIGQNELIANATLQATMRTEYRNLLTLQIGPDSWLYPYATEMLVLINDIQERLVPIYQAWQVRMCYPTDAADHRDVIVAPLAQDLYPSGLSIFKADFSDRYARANPNG